MKKFKFTISGNEYEVEVLKSEGTLAEVEVNGTHYEVEIERKEVESKTPILVRSQAKKDGAAPTLKQNTNVSTGGGVTNILAPLPGNIMQIMCKVGDVVKRGDKLLMYEAMKMENNLLAEKDGTIKTIKVNTGDSVLQGDVLIIME